MAKKQLSELLARQRLSHLIKDPAPDIVPLSPFFPPQYTSILYSTFFSDWFTAAAKEMDIATPRLPSTILSLPDPKKLSTERVQAAQSIVNGLLNAGFPRFPGLTPSHCSECFFHDAAGRWTDGFQKNQGAGLLLASAAQALVYLGSPFQGLNMLIDLLQHSKTEVRQGAALGVGLLAAPGLDPRDDLPLNVLLPALEGAEEKGVTMAAELALALSYAGMGEARPDLLPIFEKGIREGGLEVMGVSALAAGLVFLGSGNVELLEAMKKRVSEVKEADENQLPNLLLGFGLSLLFTVSPFPQSNA